MSSLWNVEIINKGKNWVDFKVRLIHPDAGSFPETKGFALLMLLQMAYEFDENYNYIPKCPLGEQFATDQFYDAEVVSERAGDYIESVQIYRIENAPFDEAEMHRLIDEQVSNQGFNRDDPEWDNTWDECFSQYWDTPGNLPEASYRVAVTKPEWIEQAEPGATFESAAWSPEGPYRNENFSIEIGTPPDALVPEDLLDFPLSYQPGSERDMDMGLIETMVDGDDEADKSESGLMEVVEQHGKFLRSGGAGGSWTLLSVSGLPLNLYQGAAGSEGTQLVFRLKKIPNRSCLKEKDLRFADFSGCMAKEVDFSQANLEGSVATDSIFTGSLFIGSNLQKVDFSGSNLQNCDFSGADLSYADFENADCTGCDFRNAKLNNARFPGTVLRDIKR